uniref:Immunoglobulin superfamily member 23 n=1 Tax=Panthera leo TaxID=9689 RepID=A0A8C8X9E0_PANLE
RGTKPQSPFSQNPAPACSPPTTTTNPVLAKGTVGGQFPAQASRGVMLLTFPSAVQGIIQSGLNYSVILECLASHITPTPVLHWTLDGEPYDTGNMLIIRRLSWGHLGTYVCTAKNSQGEYPSNPVTISLPQDNVEPTEAEPIEPDPVLSVSGGAAVALLVAANVGAMMLIGGVGFTIVQSLRIHRRRLRMCC